MLLLLLVCFSVNFAGMAEGKVLFVFGASSLCPVLNLVVLFFYQHCFADAAVYVMSTHWEKM